MTVGSGIPFTKLHGLGNDYLYLDVRVGLSRDWPRLARAMSDRHFGVGADGIILIEPSAVALVKMRIFNADGSESEMCGNGLRGLAKWLYDRGESGRHQVIETGAGLLEPEIIEEDREGARLIRVNMGPPRFRRDALPIHEGEPSSPFLDEMLEVDGETLTVSCASMGNPHLVVFGDLWSLERLLVIGPKIEHHPAFPARINVHTVEVTDKTHLRMRHWERGSGLTLACGTGVAAAVALAYKTGRSDAEVTVEVPGGELSAVSADDGNIYLTGPAVEVFRGTYGLD